MNAKKIKILFWVVAVPLFFAFYWFIVGSFEMFPSDDDIAQGRLKALILLMIFAVIEGGLYFWFRRCQAIEREQPHESENA